MARIVNKESSSRIMTEQSKEEARFAARDYLWNDF